MTLTLLANNGVKPASATTQGPFNLTSSSPNCTSGNTGLVCTYSITAPVGSDIFLATTYKSSNGTGQALGSGAVALSVTQNSANSANLSLTGPVNSIALLSDTTTLGNVGDASARHAPGSSPLAARRKTASATVTTSEIVVLAKDAAGNVILNPTTYDAPITLTLNLADIATNGVKLTVTYAGLPGEPTSPASTGADGGTLTVYAPADTITLTDSSSQNSYGEASISATFTPTSGPNMGVPQSATPLQYYVGPPGNYVTISPSSVNFYNVCTGSTPCSYSVAPTITEPGYSGAFAIDASYCSGVVRIDPNNTITPLNPGLCYLYAYDTNQNYGEIEVAVLRATASLGLTAMPTSVTYGQSSTIAFTSQAYDVNGQALSSSEQIVNGSGIPGSAPLSFLSGGGDLLASPPPFQDGFQQQSATYNGSGTASIVAQLSFGTILSPQVTIPVNAGLLWSSFDPRFTQSAPGLPASIQFQTLNDPVIDVTITPGGGTPYTGTATVTTTGANAMACAQDLTLTPVNFGSSITQSGGAYQITLTPYDVTNAIACTLTVTEDAAPSVSSTLSLFINNLQFQVEGKKRQ